MDNAGRSFFSLSRRFMGPIAFALASSACGFGGQVELGDNGGIPGVPGGGVETAAGGTAAGGTAAGGAGFGGGGSGGTGTQAGGGTSNSLGTPSGALRMDATGVVPFSSNSFGIDGGWYAYSDEIDGGQTRIAGYHEGVVPFVKGVGMCIDGTTQAGTSDNFKTWGAGIGIALNSTDGTPKPLVNPPACFTIVISADAQYPTDLRADLWGDADAQGQPVNVPLSPGSNEVCWREASVFKYCSDSLECQTPDSLNVGLSKINVTAPSGSVAGPIAFCIESITPHN